VSGDATLTVGDAGRWLEAPWAGALLRFIADPAADLDPECVPSWPQWAPLEVALAAPLIRQRLGRFLVSDPPGAIAATLAASQSARQRLALIPAADALSLIASAVAWLHAPRLSALLQRAEVDVARSAIGPDAFAFALGAARLMPRPAAGLRAALDRLAGDATGREGQWLADGEILFGLAIGAAPEATRARMRLRRPAGAWARIVALCQDDPAGPAAFGAMQRLIREMAPAWSSWLS
jgi:hypothetical protein